MAATKTHHIKHGLYNPADATYRTWCGMRKRCSPINIAHTKYYDRGITVCQEWDDYTVFLRDMGPRPEGGYSIDRIDNDKGYCKGNCRWATRLEQTENRSNKREACWRGETLSLAKWSKRTGLSYRTIIQRLDAGWPVAKALSTQSKRRKIKHLGQAKTMAEWAHETGINYYKLRSRLRYGWPLEQALKP